MSWRMTQPACPGSVNSSFRHLASVSSGHFAPWLIFFRPTYPVFSWSSSHFRCRNIHSHPGRISSFLWAVCHVPYFAILQKQYCGIFLWMVHLYAAIAWKGFRKTRQRGRALVRDNSTAQLVTHTRKHSKQYDRKSLWLRQTLIFRRIMPALMKLTHCYYYFFKEK